MFSRTLRSLSGRHVGAVLGGGAVVGAIAAMRPEVAQAETYVSPLPFCCRGRPSPPPRRYSVHLRADRARAPRCLPQVESGADFKAALLRGEHKMGLFIVRLCLSLPPSLQPVSRRKRTGGKLQLLLARHAGAGEPLRRQPPTSCAPYSSPHSLACLRACTELALRDPRRADGPLGMMMRAAVHALAPGRLPQLHDPPQAVPLTATSWIFPRRASTGC